MLDLRPDAKLIERDLEAGETVAGHFHEAGHFSIFIGHVTVKMNGAAHDIANGFIYVPAKTVHDVYAHKATRMFCVGSEKF